MNRNITIKLVFIVVLTTSSLYGFSGHITSSSPQWGWPTHFSIVEETINQLPEDWQDLFNAHIQLVKAGSIIPDQWGDWDNHLYYPSAPGAHTAPQAIEQWYNWYEANLSVGNYYDGIWAGAVMSHYFCDINIPVHTDEYWDGHSAYETDINRNLESLTIGTITIDTDITSITDYTIAAATHANQYYDDIKTAYPDSTVNGKVVSDANIKAITEEQLTKSISGLASIWLKGINNTAAAVPVSDSIGNALLDRGHGNDYAATELQNMYSYLTQIGYNPSWNEDDITATDLEDVDFLVITALQNNLSASELSAVSDWLTTNDNCSLFITGRGDFNDIAHAGINDLLETVGTAIRMNDDNVYTVSADPTYYQDWYIYTDNIQAPAGEELPEMTDPIHFFSPNSLYFDGDTTNVQLLANGTGYHYQSDENTPAPAVIWDDTDDGSGGEVIPLMALETLSSDNDRLIVFGDTTFSDYSFGPSGFHDNELLIPMLIDWVLFDNTGADYSYLPNIIITTNNTVSAGSVSIEYRVTVDITGVDLYLDGVLTESDDTAPFEPFVIDLEAGSYNVTIVAEVGSTKVADILALTVATATGTTTSWPLLPVIIAISCLGVISRRKKK